MNSEKLYIYGKKPVLESINADEGIEKIYLVYGMDDGVISAIRTAARARDIKIATLDRKSFARLEAELPRGTKSQGVIAQHKLINTMSVHELIDLAFSKEENPTILALDGISDPHNLGAISRAVECSGAAGMLIPQRNSAPITPLAMKVSAGALNHIHVAEASNLNSDLEDLKNAGFWIAGTDMNADKDYTDEIYDKPTVIVIGSEGKGLRPSTKKHCDFMIGINMAGKTESLNASVAAGVILFEVLRQKRAAER